jgi:hypothetical protein
MNLSNYKRNYYYYLLLLLLHYYYDTSISTTDLQVLRICPNIEDYIRLIILD